MPEPGIDPAQKRRAVTLLIVTQIAVMGLWFSSAAVIAEMGREAGLGPSRLAWLSTAVQLGFAVGALGYAALGLADRYDPRRVFCLSALVGAGANLAMLAVPPGGAEAILLRALTGAAMAGVYPVGMKIMTGWGRKDRALLVSLLVAALTLGSASPHLAALLGGADWRITIWASTLAALAGALIVLMVPLGPFHARARGLDIGAVALAWRDRRIRLAILGYLGHMWELYALWAWVGIVAAASYAEAGAGDGASLGKLTAFLAIALGGLACVPAGRAAVRHGSARTAEACLWASGAAGLVAAALYGGPVWAVMPVLILWGIAVIPDSALYSTLVADAAPPERAGSLMAFQTAIGFLMTAGTVQVAPFAAEALGWPTVLASLALGPAVAITAMRLLRRPAPEG